MKSVFFLAISFAFTFTICAQENLTYQKPPKEILDLVDYERAPQVIMDSKKEMMVFLYRNTYKSLDDLNQDELRLGGLRINPQTNISSTTTYINNLKVRKLLDKAEIQVKGLPGEPKIANLSWSPDEKQIAFTHTSSAGVELWVLDIANASAKKVGNLILNANMGNPISWFKDGKSLLVRALPKDRKPLIDTRTNLPVGPVVSTSDGSKAQNRTYQDLLKNPTDETNFENIASSELYKVGLDGSVQLWLQKAMYISESFSPDGSYVLVSTIEKPFSYIVPYNRFPSREIVYTHTGKMVREVNFTPLTEVLPKGFMATRTGKRNLDWRNDKAATLYFVQALDNGDPEVKADFRDELFSWEAPFSAEPVSLIKLQQRFSAVNWGNNTLAVVSDSWWNTRNSKTYIFNPSNNSVQPRIIWDRNYDDKYADPGEIQMKKGEFGTYVMDLQGSDVFLFGEGHSEKGQFPFINRMNLSTGTSKLVYRSALTNKLETLQSFVNVKNGEVLIRMESATEYPNFYIRNIYQKGKALPRKITDFKNPFTPLEKVHKEVIKYKREDGVELSGTLYLPAGYDKTKKEKLPMIMWAYPREFKDKSSAGQTTSNPNQFTFPSYGSPIYWVTRGYVVLDNAAFPIIGEGDEQPNDTFLEQLVANAKAAIDAVDALGYIDRTKVAVGGHSYGAFMTANLLTHSDLFACGIARSGAYNRTLTPFGFQSEERSYWDVPEVYNTMSPFMTADKMNTPLLLVHGEADNNPGTFTLQSERYFNALKGMGKPTRLVILPKESHGYVAKENILHLLWEQDRWLEMYLKGKK
jgi:dipeptidyl aminopeptidase/acylaminoacyl peptidase